MARRSVLLAGICGLLIGFGLMVPLPVSFAQGYLEWPIQAPSGGVIRTNNVNASTLLFRAWNTTTSGWTTLMTMTSGAYPELTFQNTWDDLVAPAGAINPLGADGQATVISDGSSYIGCLEFDAAGETAVVQWQLSHATTPNTDIHPHIHWLASGGDVTGSSVFGAKFKHCPLTGTCTSWTEFANGSITVEPADVEGGMGMTEWELADSTYDFGISDVVLMQFKLVSTTITDSIVCSADLHYQRNAFGSVRETVR
jgi:hypothetical protein